MVLVRLKAGKSSVEAEVIVDTGGDTVVVDTTGDPSHLTRLPRRAIIGNAPKKTTVAVAVVEPHAPVANVLRSPTALFCVETARGLCALQRQTHKLTKPEMVEGAMTFCDAWAQSMSAPLIEEPTCPQCRSHVGLSNKG